MSAMRFFPPGLLLLVPLLATCSSSPGATDCGGGCPFLWQTCSILSTCINRTCDPTSADCGPRASCVDTGMTGMRRYQCQPRPCLSDGECNNGLFCDGTERCNPGGAGAHPQSGCVPGMPACAAGQTCDEIRDTCTTSCAMNPDVDGDGFDSIACGGSDCDDNNGGIGPARTEICDAMDVDEDCDSSTFGDRDADSDGFIDIRCCNISGGARLCGNDCDDSQRGVHPIQNEVCNQLDDDCDAAIDETVLIDAYVDMDGDNHGTSTTAQVCDYQLGSGYALTASDCDDTNAAIQPGAMVCVGGQTPAEVNVCRSDGTYIKVNCPSTQICWAQPNGTGICR
jgi:hypothetical protein